MMEFWPAGKAIRITEESDDIEWIDARQLKKIPAMVPADRKFIKKWEAENPSIPAPQFMQLGTETKKAVFDVQVSIGEGIPTNKMALFNIILSMSKMVLPDEQTGQPRSLLSYQQVQKMIEDLLGLPIAKVIPEEQAAVAAVNNNIPNATQGRTDNPYIMGATEAGVMSGAPSRQE